MASNNGRTLNEIYGIDVAKAMRERYNGLSDEQIKDVLSGKATYNPPKNSAYLNKLRANAKKKPFYRISSKIKKEDALAVDRRLNDQLAFVRRLPLNNKHPPVAGGRRTKRKTHRKHKRTHKRHRSNK